MELLVSYISVAIYTLEKVVFENRIQQDNIQQ